MSNFGALSINSKTGFQEVSRRTNAETDALRHTYKDLKKKQFLLFLR